MSEEHTPTPWGAIDGHSVVSIVGPVGVSVAATNRAQYYEKFSEIDSANAAFIVTAVNSYATDKALIADLAAELEDALSGWEEGAQYKGDYLREKHGDAEGIAKGRAVLARVPKP